MDKENTNISSSIDPKVSVVMSVYNGALYLREAIDSILNQTFKDFEFIIINDYSSDNSEEILKEYAEKDKRVKVITNKFNLGLTKSLNIGIKESQGRYIARMDADDIAYPERLQKQINFLENNLDYGVVGAFAKVINDKGESVDNFEYEETDREIKNSLIKWNSIIHPLAFMRKSVLNKVCGYDESFKYAQDYDLWLRLSKKTKFINLPEYLLYYRISDKSITGSKNKEQALCAMRARWNAIKNGYYSPLNVIFLLRPLMSILLPKTLKQMYK
jgi:glycosyltransferase involved in cell wall biosynthesis